MNVCCADHIDGPVGACCDPDDCSPCCATCPTCPAVSRMRGGGTQAGVLGHRRRRDERGALDVGGIVGAVVIVIAVCVALRLVTGTNPVEWIDTAVEWCVSTIRSLTAPDPGARR